MTIERLAVAALCALWASVCPAAGMESITLPGTAHAPPIKAVIWTPCAQTPQPLDLGPFTIRTNRDCPIQGQALPLVVISHGNRGTRFGHHDTAIALADAGFVAVTFDHPGNSFGDNDAEHSPAVFASRVTDMRRVINFVTQEWRQRGVIDRKAIGAFGFSRGGYTVLALAGAVPDLQATTERYCSSLMSWIMPLCLKLRFGDDSIRPTPDPRVRAIVAVDPLNLFDAAGLQRVHVPVQLWASEFGGDGVELNHVKAIKAGLSPPPDFHLVRGAGHFAFLAPCPQAIAKDAPEICVDPPGFDRVALHRTLNASVVGFFQRHIDRRASLAGGELPGAP